MTTVDCITALSCQVDMPLHTIPTHLGATLGPSEVVPPSILPALTGVVNRALYHWPTRDSSALFPEAPRAHPSLSPLQEPSGVDGGLRGRPDGARRHHPLGDRPDACMHRYEEVFSQGYIRIRVAGVRRLMAIVCATTSWNMVKG